MTGLKFDIPREKYDKIMHWVNQSTDEVSGFGTVTFKDGSFALEEVFLLAQKNGGAHTDIDAKALADLEFDVIKSRATGQLNFWWHSHVMMPVFWSGTDTATIRELGGNGWILATVFNQKNEMRTAFCASVDLPMVGKTIHLQDSITTTITGYYPVDLIAAWDKEYKEKVTDLQIKEPPLWARYRDNEHSPGQWDQLEQRFTPMTPEPKNSLLTGTKVTHAWDVEMAEEARMLGMKFKAYKKIQMSQDWKKIEELELKLSTLREKKEGYYGSINY